MATCQDVAVFLQQVNARSVTAALPPPDVTTLQQAGLVQVLNPDQLAQLEREVVTLQQAQLALAQESSQRGQLEAQIGVDTRKSHSILFHMEGVDKQQAALSRLQTEQNALKSLNDDLAKRQQDFAALLEKKAVLDMVCPFDGGYTAITTTGRLALRDLTVRLYRVGDQPFGAYWDQSKQIDSQLATLAQQSALVESPLASMMPEVDRSYLWAVAIGVVKESSQPSDQLAQFAQAYSGLAPYSSNLENRLMAAEILSVLPHPLETSLQSIGARMAEIKSLGVPEPSALGVAAILLLGQREDGSFALEPLRAFLQATSSFESAALLAIVNRPFPELAQRFASFRGLYTSWGYSTSEDTELSAAYLAASEIPYETVGAKVAILARGLATYLQYPLVAASILASIPVLEANETLNLTEKAYEILGQRTGPMSQAELICLAVRMIHGIQVQSVDELDPTARQVAPPPSFSYVGYAPRLWMPVFIAHGAYFATFSGIGGVHPGHVHGFSGGGWGGGGFAG